jgi:serine/threonine protein kinase
VISQRRRRGDYFSLSEVREFVCSMVCFFAKMQRKGYMHRDIKPDNILLSRCKQKYKIVDFGFAIKLNHYSTQNVAGTMEYVSPKLRVKFKDNSIMVEGHTFKDDVYSFGKTLLELMLL